MKKTNTSQIKAFTLIEVLIVVGILGMMLSATYAPYSHYQKKALVKQGQKEIVQSIYEARNLAINGLDVGGTNVSIGLYMDTSELDNKNKTLTYFGYPDRNPPSAFPTISTVDVIKVKDLPNGIQLEEIEGQTQFLFFFDAISGEGKYYSNAGSFTETNDGEVDIDISYKGATTSTLQATIDYYTNTYIADY